MGLIITLALGVFVLIGAAIAGLARNETAIRELSIAVALGAMVALLFADLIPDAVEQAGVLGTPLIIVGVATGFAVLCLLERLLPASHHVHVHHHDHANDPSCARTDIMHISIATTIALVVHNIIEGMSVCGVAASDTTLALLLACGVGIHNIPMGMVVYAGVRDGRRSRKAVILLAASLSTFAGGIVMQVLDSAIDAHLVAFMICLTIGLLAYIIALELVPQAIRASDKKRMVAGIAAGLVLVLASSFLA